MTTTIVIAATAVILALLTAHSIDSIDRLRESIMAGIQEIVDALTEQLVKAQREIVDKIADVQAQLDAAQVPVEQVNLTALTEAVQALDDIVPDAEPVVDEAVAEEAPVE